MIIDSYSVGIKFRIDQNAMRNIDRYLRNVEQRARAAFNGNLRGGSGGNTTNPQLIRTNQLLTKIASYTKSASDKIGNLRRDGSGGNNTNPQLTQANKLLKNIARYTRGTMDKIDALGGGGGDGGLNAQNAQLQRSNQLLLKISDHTKRAALCCESRRDGGGGGGGGGRRDGGGGIIAAGISKAKAGVGVAGYAAYKFASSAVTTYADFQQAMIDAQIFTSATEEQLVSLENKARELGKTTSLSATEAASAIVMLAKNNQSYDQIMGGMLDSTVNLSLAMGSDLSASADFLTDVMSQFKLEASEADKVVNQLVGTASASKFGFQDLVYAFANVGGIAGKTGTKLEDLTALIALVSSSFAKGGDTGTSLKTFFTRMVADTKPLTEAMKELNIINKENQNQYFTPEGEIKSMAEIVELLSNSFKKMSGQQRLAFSKILGGEDAMRGILAVAELTTKQFEEMRKKIEETDAALIRMARDEGLKQRFKTLQSAWEEFQLSLTTPELVRSQERMLSWATDMLLKLSEFGPTITNSLMTAFQSITGGLGAAISGIMSSGSKGVAQKMAEDYEQTGSRWESFKRIMKSPFVEPKKIPQLTQPAYATSAMSENKKAATSSTTNNDIKIEQNFMGPVRPDSVKDAAKKGIEEASEMYLNGA